jgi:hypothetical protein
VASGPPRREAAAAEELAEVRERVELVDTLTTGCLAAAGFHRPRRYRWRKRRMIEIEYNPPATLAAEAKEIANSLSEHPKTAMRRALIIRLEEIGKISPQAVLEATNGDLFQLLIYIFAGGSKREPIRSTRPVRPRTNDWDRQGE